MMRFVDAAVLGIVALASCSSAEECGETGQCVGSPITQTHGSAMIQARVTKVRDSVEGAIGGKIRVFGRELTKEEVANATRSIQNKSAPIEQAVSQTDPLLSTMKEVETLDGNSTLGKEAADVENELTHHATINVSEALDVINEALAHSNVESAAANGALLTADDVAKVVGGHYEDSDCASENGTDDLCFQGDMRASNSTQLGLLQTLAKHAGNPWTNGQVKYCFASDLSDMTKQLFERATVQITMAVPCITFQNVGNPDGSDSHATSQRCGETNAVFVQSKPAEGCWSYIGMLGGTQALQLQHPGCSVLGTVIHEIGHAVGMHHEQARPDRDSYVTVHWGNMPNNIAHNFAVDANEDTLHAYDYTSIMHYSSHAFSTNGQATITTPGGAHDSSLGERVGLGQSDADQLAAFYGCTAATISASIGCIDTDLAYCADRTHCSTSSDAEKCCGCQGGLLYQCWGDACATRASQQKPADPTVAACVADRTSLWNGAYPCVYENTCDMKLRFKCLPHMEWQFDVNPHSGYLLPPSYLHDEPCKKTNCTIVSISPPTPSPPPPPPTAAPTPSPTPSPTVPPTMSPTMAPATFNHCVKDVTALWNGYYPCAIQKACTFAVRVECENYPGQYFPWDVAIGTYNLPPFGTDTCDGKCTVTKWA